MTSTPQTVDPLPQGLSFTRYVVEEIGSVAFPFKGRKTQDLTGIYILEFKNGERYIGQAVNVVRRVADHRRRWADLYALEFAPCPVEDLNAYEQLTISHQEEHYRLRNKSLTNLPGGPGDFTVSTEEEETLQLPSDRAARKRIGTAAPASRQKFWELLDLPVYEGELLPLLGRYLNETIPDPIGSQRYLWTITALPATNKRRGERRITTVSCGNLETLVVIEQQHNHGIAYGGFINLAGETLTQEHLSGIQETGDIWQIVRPDYRHREGVIAVYVQNLETFGRLMDDPDVLDAAYRLNVGLMRQGATMYRRFHNEHLANDVINYVGAFGV